MRRWVCFRPLDPGLGGGAGGSARALSAQAGRRRPPASSSFWEMLAIPRRIFRSSMMFSKKYSAPVAPVPMCTRYTAGTFPPSPAPSTKRAWYVFRSWYMSSSERSSPTTIINSNVSDPAATGGPEAGICANRSGGGEAPPSTGDVASSSTGGRRGPVLRTSSRTTDLFTPWWRTSTKRLPWMISSGKFASTSSMWICISFACHAPKCGSASR
mmetsp:Transcript_15870/g.53476  ORF Transcript_15870/g.53476 Transcript_15870/m.53476 type:complete len:213 (-) Transcript_15870:2775-3413(-)